MSNYSESHFLRLQDFIADGSRGELTDEERQYEDLLFSVAGIIRREGRPAAQAWLMADRDCSRHVADRICHEAVNLFYATDFVRQEAWRNLLFEKLLTAARQWEQQFSLFASDSTDLHRLPSASDDTDLHGLSASDDTDLHGLSSAVSPQKSVRSDAGRTSPRKSVQSDAGKTSPRKSVQSDAGRTSPRKSVQSDAGRTSPRKSVQSDAGKKQVAPSAKDYEAYVKIIKQAAIIKQLSEKVDDGSHAITHNQQINIFGTSVQDVGLPPTDRRAILQSEYFKQLPARHQERLEMEIGLKPLDVDQLLDNSIELANEAAGE